MGLVPWSVHFLEVFMKYLSRFLFSAASIYYIACSPLKAMDKEDLTAGLYDGPTTTGSATTPAKEASHKKEEGVETPPPLKGLLSRDLFLIIRPSFQSPHLSQLITSFFTYKDWVVISEIGFRNSEYFNTLPVWGEILKRCGWNPKPPFKDRLSPKDRLDKLAMTNPDAACELAHLMLSNTPAEDTPLAPIDPITRKALILLDSAVGICESSVERMYQVRHPDSQLPKLDKLPFLQIPEKYRGALCKAEMLKASHFLLHEIPIALPRYHFQDNANCLTEYPRPEDHDEMTQERITKLTAEEPYILCAEWLKEQENDPTMDEGRLARIVDCFQHYPFIKRIFFMQENLDTLTDKEHRQECEMILCWVTRTLFSKFWGIRLKEGEEVEWEPIEFNAYIGAFDYIALAGGSKYLSKIDYDFTKVLRAASLDAWELRNGGSSNASLQELQYLKELAQDRDAYPAHRIIAARHYKKFERMTALRAEAKEESKEERKEEDNSDKL